MSYTAPVDDMLFAMRHVARLDEGIASGLYADLADGMAEAVLEEAGRFASDRLAPLNAVGDRTGAKLENGQVITPPGWREAYRDWAAAGWSGIVAEQHFGGQGLPTLLGSCCTEIWNSANMAFALNPLLTIGAIEAISAHATQALKDLYLPKMISGEWTGTMNLTEPQAGSDLAALRAKAERAGDGSYRITGNKIFITYGEHELTDNIVHLVLARLPDAPPGTRGISLFLVPKYLVNADGSLGARNDVRCAGLEHKLGIHASPTCTMVYGDKDGAIGWLVGEENRGLNCMFTMMNNARLNVGIQGVAIAERAYQQALRYALDRRQGKAPGSRAAGMSALVEHPDIKRMLLDMRSKTVASRAICLAVAAALDRSDRLPDIEARGAALEEASLLTPVAKGYSTDIGIDVASTGVQIHGGMGFIEETGAAQHYRDARIAAIYEGTNGIQAMDLVLRKLPLAGGERVAALIARYRKDAQMLAALTDAALARAGAHLGAAVDALERSTRWLRGEDRTQAEALAGATPYMRLFGIVAGGAYLSEIALAARVEMASGSTDPAHARRLADCRFFIENNATLAAGLESAILEGAETVNTAYADAAV